MFVFNDPTSSATPSLLKKCPVNAKGPVHHPQCSPPPRKVLPRFLQLHWGRQREASLTPLVALGCIIMQM